MDRKAAPAKVTGPDGLIYSPDENERLDQLMLSTFGRGGGRQVLDHLRAITIEYVSGPHVTDAELRHREGGRFIVGIIESRMRAAQARKEKKK